MSKGFLPKSPLFAYTGEQSKNGINTMMNKQTRPEEEGSAAFNIDTLMEY